MGVHYPYKSKVALRYHGNQYDSIRHAYATISAMEQQSSRSSSVLWYILIGIIVLLLGGGGYLGYRYYTLMNEHEALTSTLGTTEAELASKINTLRDANQLISELSDALEEAEEELKDEKDRNDAFQDRINDIAGTVSDLDKLSKTDEELLQKYSKVSFLNEHYVPSNLSDIPKEYVYNEDRNHELHSQVLPFLEDMIDDAKDDDIDLWVVSAYRSFEYQSQLKGTYTVTYGSGANAFSADQGFSEHQLGTTVDFTTSGIGGGLQGFGTTPAYEWLVKNAHKYGFTLSYPEGNAYYVYEPWHWRFVGEELAKDLNDDDAHFYDWDQRTIDQYLLHIFD